MTHNIKTKTSNAQGIYEIHQYRVLWGKKVLFFTNLITGTLKCISHVIHIWSK